MKKTSLNIHDWQKKFLFIENVEEKASLINNPKDYLDENQIQSRESYRGERFRIEYQAPKGYYAVGEGDVRGQIAKAFFNTEEEAIEHAQLEIEGFLES